MTSNCMVMKFGGTSVGDAAAIVRAAEIVRGRLEERPVVVVSAMARVPTSCFRWHGRPGPATAKRR